MSLRARLLAGMAVVALVLVAAAVAITRATEHQLIEQVDQQLERAVPQVRGRPGNQLRPTPPGSEEGEDGGGEGDGGSPPSAIYAALIDPESLTLTTLYLPTSFEDDPNPPDLDAAEAIERAGERPFTVSDADGDVRFRAIVRTEGPSDQHVLFAIPLSDVDESVEQLMVILALASGTILAVMGLVTFWVLRLGVGPLRRMTAAATAIGEGDLSQRVPASEPGTEAGDLGEALNQMLGRIEGAFDERARAEQRLRQFVADASHELRTPVTTIRGYAELYRMGGLEQQPALDEAMRRTEQEAARMGQLVGDLLDLARLDQGRPLQLATLDLRTLAADAVADARAVEPQRTIALEAPDDPVLVTGDEAHLRQILANLLANARVHTPVEAAVAVRLRAEPGQVVLEVADQGPGMAPEVAAHAFERFYRADPARTRDRGGSGLGLSIVAAMVAAHGGTATLDSTPGQGTTVRVTLPAATP